MPYVESHFRIIKKPYARVLSGGSTGGWESLALQLYHPEFFGGTWTFFPDPIDFRRYQLIDIYADSNAFVVPNAAPGAPERMMQQSPEAQPVATMRSIAQMEYASGTHGRSAAQLDIWNAVYGPVGDDGYPRQLFDLRTGEIDPTVATYMRDHGYDLRYYAEQNWPRIGPQLVGKLHILTGDMDDFYLAPAVYMFEDFLAGTNNPHYDGRFPLWTSNEGSRLAADDQRRLVAGNGRTDREERSRGGTDCVLAHRPLIHRLAGEEAVCSES